MFTLVSRLIGHAGLLGVFMLMIVENVFPLLPLRPDPANGGLRLGRGAFNPWLATPAGGVGSTVGAYDWYAFGRRVGIERLVRWSRRHGRWLTLTPAEIRTAHAWLHRFGPAALCIGRALPGVRGVICIPAGVSGMGVRTFLIWCFVGSTLWSALLTGARYVLRARSPTSTAGSIR